MTLIEAYGYVSAILKETVLYVEWVLEKEEYGHEFLLGYEAGVSTVISTFLRAVTGEYVDQDKLKVSLNLLELNIEGCEANAIVIVKKAADGDFY